MSRKKKTGSAAPRPVPNQTPDLRAPAAGTSATGHGRDWIILLAICLAAALKIFFFAAAFPFFNNVDEEAHFDTIWKYSKWKWPEKDHYRNEPDSLEYILLFNSPEYRRLAQRFPGGVYPPPLWTQPAYMRTALLETLKKRDIRNYETQSPPLYYLLAGGWQALGRTLGLAGAGLLYWSRFLNLPVVLLLVLLAWLVGRRFKPDEPLFRWGLPLLIVALPQDVFYSLSNDVTSPLLSGATFYLLGRICLNRDESWLVYLGAGLGLAGAILVKLSNMPLALAAPTALWLGRMGMEGSVPGLMAGRWGRTGLAAVAATLPVGAWLARNYYILGDLTGTRHKMEYLGWTYKPLGEIFSHPIFSISGPAYFWHNLLASFWRGEFVWALERFTTPAADYFYSLSSLVFLISAGVGLWWNRKQGIKDPIMVLAAVIFGGAVLYLAGLSLLFDFGRCPYPSRALPYFVSGRLILCALLPFGLLYIEGLRRLVRRLAPRIDPLTVLLVLLALVAAHDFLVRLPVVYSDFNFFHAPWGAVGFE